MSAVDGEGEMVLVSRARGNPKRYHYPSEGDPKIPECGNTGAWYREKAKSKLPDHDLCEKCKGGFQRQEQTNSPGSNAESELPEGVAESQVRDLCESEMRLGNVAHRLGISRAEARVITVDLGCYSEVSDVRRGGFE